MAQYNLINTALIETNASGTKQLSTEELTFLYNGNTTSSGITILDTDTLYLDINLYNRINTEDFNLYIEVAGDRAAALVNVDFYYKNAEEDAFILCSKGHDLETFYPVSLPELFAPRFLRIVVSSLSCTIFEIKLTNEDTQVAFGSDGTTSRVAVNHLYGGYTELPIFNNSPIGTPVVNAYVGIDYQEQESDLYLKLASSAEGEYKGLTDGAFLHTDDTSFKYTWSRGVFEGTRVDGDNIQTDPNYYGTAYYYTTPVMSLGDPLMSSFLITKQTVASGTYITWADPSDKPIVKVRSSNIPPLPFSKFFITSTESDYDINIYEGDLNTGAVELYKTFTTTSVSNNSVIFDQHSGTFLVLALNTRVYRYKYREERGAAGVLMSSTSTNDNNFINNWGVDGYGNVWGYASNGGYKLRVLNSSTLEGTTILTDAAISFVTDLAPSLKYAGCWFTDPGVKMLKHVDIEGTLLVSKSLNQPTYLCSLYDGGCLVIDSGAAKIYRVDYYGTTLLAITYTSTISFIDISYGISEESTTTFHERFWLLSSLGYVYQMTLAGETISDTRYTSATSIHAFLGGCLVHCPSINKTYQLNSDGVQVRIWDYDGQDTMGIIPYPVYMTYEVYLTKVESSTLLPLYLDPVWGDYIEEGWHEVIDDGYLLPFANYHQLKYNFTPVVIDSLLINGDFETGDLTGWTVTDGGWRVIDTTFFEGAYCLDMTSEDRSSSMYQWMDLSTYVGMDFPLLDDHPQGYYFNLNFWIKRNGTRGYSSYVTVEFYDNSNHVITATELIGKYDDSISDGLWYNEALQRKVPSGTRYIKLTIQFTMNTYYNSRQQFDNFSAQLMHSPELNSIGVPEPIKLMDIAPQTSQNVYIKTEFPVNTVNNDYETRLKCWWGAQEA